MSFQMVIEKHVRVFLKVLPGEFLQILMGVILKYSSTFIPRAPGYLANKHPTLFMEQRHYKV